MLKYWDEEAKQVKEIPAKDLDEKLRDLLELLKRCVEKLQRVGVYDLKDFEVSLSLQAGVFIVTAKGSIRLRYER